MKWALLHTVLLGAYPVLFLHAHNFGHVMVQNFWVILALAALSGPLLWLLLLPAIRDAKAAALAASWLLVLFHSYGRVFESMAGFSLAGVVLGRNRYIIPLWVLGMAAGAWLFHRIRRTPRIDAATRLANIFALALLALPVLQLARVQYGAPHGVAEASAPADQLPAASLPKASGRVGLAGKPLPDIYYIIPDSYVSDSTLKTTFGHDNGPFTDYLESKGFFVAPHSLSNYAFTNLSLPSSMNMVYLNSLREMLGETSTDKRIPSKMMLENKVMAFLKSQGYTLVNAGSWWGPTFMNQQADLNLQSSRFDEFTLELLKCTLLHSFMEEFTSADLRRKVLHTFEKLQEIPLREEPTFTFAHIICPHPPYIFNRDGGKVPTMRRVLTKIDPRELYLDQVRFVNGKLMEAVDRILASSPTPPIIVIQGDHGAAYIRNSMGQTTLLPGEDYLRDQMRILNAYYLPGVEAGALPDTITPVNTFRFIFNRYFGTDLPLLEDKSFYSSHALPYRFTDVTEIVDYR